jgi:phage gp36-like protein
MAAYGTQTDLAQLGTVPADVLATISSDDQNAELEAQSRVADSYLAARFILPLSAYGKDLVNAVCSMAAYVLMARRGYAPDGHDSVFRQRFDDAIAWLRDVSRGLVSPVGIVDSSAVLGSSVGARVIAPAARGW